MNKVSKDEYMKYRTEFMDKISDLIREAKEDLDKKCRLDLLVTLEDYAKVTLSIYRCKNR